nr:hypothetical protein CFP56_43771 [Quercus suber]
MGGEVELWAGKGVYTAFKLRVGHGMPGHFAREESRDLGIRQSRVDGADQCRTLGGRERRSRRLFHTRISR